MQQIIKCPECKQPITMGNNGRGNPLRLDAEPVMGYTLASDPEGELFMRFVPVWSEHVCRNETIKEINKDVRALKDGIYAGLEGA